MELAALMKEHPRTTISEPAATATETQLQLYGRRTARCAQRMRLVGSYAQAHRDDPDPGYD